MRSNDGDIEKLMKMKISQNRFLFSSASDAVFYLSVTTLHLQHRIDEESALDMSFNPQSR